MDTYTYVLYVRRTLRVIIGTEICEICKFIKRSSKFHIININSSIIDI